MFVVELVMQGVRGIRELARLRFQSGFNLVSAGSEAGKTTTVDTLQRLMFPNGGARDMDSLVSRHTPDSSRGALVVCSDDGSYFRVIQDFGRRAVNLSRYNASTKEFDLLYKDWTNSAQFMAGLAAGAAENDFAQVFLVRREQTAGRAMPSMSAALSAPKNDRPGPAAAAAAAKLAELRAVLRRAEEAADAEYRYQSAKLTLEELQKKISALDESERKKSEIESLLAGLKECETLPGNLAELIEEHERSMNQKTADADSLNREMEGLQLQLEGLPPANILTDKLFLAGAVFGVLSILAGVFVLTAEYGHYFPIGLVLSLTLMAVAAYNGSRKNVQRRAVRKSIDSLEQELIDLERNAVHQGAPIAAVLRATRASSTAELKDKADSYRHYRSLLADLEEGRQRTLAGSTPEHLRQQYDQQQQEAAELEKAARERAHDAVDTYGIRQDIERLEQESAAGDPGACAAVPELLDVAAAAADPGADGFADVLCIAARISGIELETLTPAVEAAAQRNLSAVTGGRYVRIEIGHDGPPLVRDADDRAVEEPELSHGTKTLVSFSLRTGLVEALAGKLRLPFILDDALAGLDPARQQAACQILRALGKKTQVVLLSANPALRTAGEPLSELK